MIVMVWFGGVILVAIGLSDFFSYDGTESRKGIRRMLIGGLVIVISIVLQLLRTY